MKRPDPSLLRVSLKTFLGEAQYRKFLEAGARAPLKYWQEQAWQKFIERYPQLEVTDTERADALEVCPVHERALHWGLTAFTDGMDFADPPERRELFPCAPHLPLEPDGLMRVHYCPDCIEAEAAYLAQRRKR